MYVLSVSARKLHVVVGICQNILSSVTLDKEIVLFTNFLVLELVISCCVPESALSVLGCFGELS